MAPEMGAQELVGHQLKDRDGNTVGKIGHVYLDDQTDTPKWVTVRTGMFGTNESFVPLEGARRVEEDVVVPFDKQTIKDSPNFDVDQHLSVDEEEDIFRHYGIQPSVPQQRTYQREERPSGDYATGDTGESERPMGYGEGGIAWAGTEGAEEATAAAEEARPAEGREDVSMTRSEERAHIGVERQEKGHARIHKYVETEEFQETVPTTREEVTVQREPISPEEADAGEARIETEEEEFVLHEERPVVSMESVPVERVRVSRDEVTEERQVRGERRKERIEVEEDEEEPPPSATS